MKTALVINTHSRNGRKMADHVEQKLHDSSKFEIIKVIRIQKLENLQKRLDELKKLSSLECVVVGSGDGTIDAVINTLKNKKDIVFGFLPLGTGNVFIKSLYQSTDIDESIRALLNGTVRKICLGEINGVRFGNIAAIGMPVSVSKNISNKFKRVVGPVAYYLSGAKQLFSHKPMLCTLITKSGEESFYTHHLLVTNGRYHGHLPVSKSASVYKNKLVLVAFGSSRSRWRYIVSIIRFTMGKHLDSPDVQIRTFKEAKLITKPTRDIEVDGEIVGKTPVQLRVLPNSIKVLTD